MNCADATDLLGIGARDFRRLRDAYEAKGEEHLIDERRERASGRRADALTHAIGAGLVRAWQRFQVQDITPAIVNAALDIKSRYGFANWDTAIVAAAKAQGCGRLYSEDLSRGQVIDNLQIVDPFR